MVYVFVYLVVFGAGDYYMTGLAHRGSEDTSGAGTVPKEPVLSSWLTEDEAREQRWT